MGASTKIIDKWDEIAYMRDVIIAGKDCEVDDSRKLLKESDSLSKVQFCDLVEITCKETKDKQKQLETEKKDNLNEIARLEKQLADLRVSSVLTWNPTV